MKAFKRLFYKSFLKNPNFTLHIKRKLVRKIINKNLITYKKISSNSQNETEYFFHNFRNTASNSNVVTSKGRSRNIACVKLIIDNKTYLYYAFSGANKKSPIRNVSLGNFGIYEINGFKNCSVISNESNKPYHYKACKHKKNENHIRNMDTEIVLLEYIHNHHKNDLKKAKHSELNMFTKLECCHSCKSVFVQWMLDYPSTEVNIFYSEKKS